MSDKVEKIMEGLRLIHEGFDGLISLESSVLKVVTTEDIEFLNTFLDMEYDVEKNEVRGKMVIPYLGRIFVSCKKISKLEVEK